MPASRESVWIPPGDLDLATSRLGGRTAPAATDSLDAGTTRRDTLQPLKIAGFWLGRHEATVGQYRRFCREMGREFPQQPGWSLSDDYPIVNITWQDARDYCAWKDGRLPTEAEWEYAARAGIMGKPFPWGDDLSHELANYQGTGGRDVWDSAAPVGSFPANAFDLYDMVGNVWEWCSDAFDVGYHFGSDGGEPRPSPTGMLRVIRGGSWGNELPAVLAVDSRFFYAPHYRNAYFGCRCAWDAKDK